MVLIEELELWGGEPTLHPQFERFVKYIGKKHPSKYNIDSIKKPINKENFIKYVRDKNFFLDEMLNKRKGPGLWTSLCDRYYEYYELIQEVFSYQCINDHNNPSIHQPLLVSRKELGIPDEKWIEIRDKCWIQNTWSATITPKGAFFCEVAGALDMLFDGPGGWVIEPDWWKREPKDFGYQLQWCEICGGALFNEGRLASEEIDDVSPMMYEKLKQVGSPKVMRGKVNVIDVSNLNKLGEKMPNTRNRYLTNYDERVSKENDTITPKRIDAIVFCSCKEDLEYIEKNIDIFAEVFDSVSIAVMNINLNTIFKNLINNLSNVKIINCVLDQWGRTLNKCISSIENKDWICVLDASSEIPENFSSRLKDVALNLGCIYRFNITGLLNKFFLFNIRAFALKQKGFDGIGTCGNISDFINLWKDDKQIVCDDNFDKIVNPDLGYWYEFAKNIQAENKEEIYRCLEKINNDIERGL